MKKADMSINVIIVAVIGLIILVVLLVVFNGKMKIFSSNAEGTCAEQGGRCALSISTPCQEGEVKKWTSGCTCTVTSETTDPATIQDCAAKAQKGIGQCCVKIL